jgi:hypothetical protein
MALNPYEPPNLKANEWFDWNRQRPEREPQRLLDDIAQAFHIARTSGLPLHRPHTKPPKFGWFWPRTSLVRTVRKTFRTLWIDEQAGNQSFDQFWESLSRGLDCELPALWECHDHRMWGTELASVQHVVNHVIACGKLGDREVPAGPVTIAMWANAQVFAGVQAVVVEQFGVDKLEVTRSAHFFKDLDAC